MHKITEVTIRNFKSCRETVLKLESFTALVGYNNAGKSNLLIALSFLKDILTNAPKDKNEKIPLAPFMLDNDSKSLNTSFYLSFYFHLCFLQCRL